MKVKNVSKRRYLHYLGKDKENKDMFAKLEPDETKEIPDDVAKIWLKTEEVVKVDDGSKDKEIERLKAENEKLKAQAESKEVSEKDELLAICKNYGIKYGNPKTVSIATLEKKIKEYEETHCQNN